MVAPPPIVERLEIQVQAVQLRFSRFENLHGSRTDGYWRKPGGHDRHFWAALKHTSIPVSSTLTGTPPPERSQRPQLT